MLAWSGYSEAKSRLWLFTHSNTEQQRKYSGMLSSCTSVRSLLFWHGFVKALIPVNKITAIFSKSILTFTFLSLTWLRMQKYANEQSVTARKGRSIHFCVANAESHQQLLQAAIYLKVKSILEKIPPISWPLMSKHFVTVRRKNSLFTGINIRQNQARGWAFICYDCLGSEGKEKRRKQEHSVLIQKPHGSGIETTSEYHRSTHSSVSL